MEVKLEEFSKACSCGRSHRLLVKRVLIESGAIRQVNGFLEAYGIDQYPVVICDTHTYEAAGRLVLEQLKSEHKDVIILDAEGLHADEHGVAKIIENLKENPSVLLAVGAGTIHDLTRYVAKEKQIPFVAIPTAASVDGFVSTVAAMTIKGFKVTYPAVSPLAVFADTDIFIKAPYRLTASGIADLLGKYTAILDWQTAHLLTDEYICEKVVKIELDAVKKAAEELEALKEGRKEAYENLMYALILSGLAMQMIGNSRPASGAEHHLSHLWEMHVINRPTKALHGEKVGVALALVCDTYKKVLDIEPSSISEIRYKGMPCQELKNHFSSLYESIIEENTPDPLIPINHKKLLENLDAVKALIANLPSGEEIRSMLRSAGAKAALEEIGLEDSVIEKSLRLSPFVRQRLTLMRVLPLLYKD
jgi:glycerol-1-phosphate dehydrogenase [NAD(P)+]